MTRQADPSPRRRGSRPSASTPDSVHTRLSSDDDLAPRSHRTRKLITVVCIAALCGGVSVAGYSIMAPRGSSALKPAAPDTVPSTEVSFTDAEKGDCVNWVPGADGVNTGFSKVDCVQPHRFEVASRENLETYPTSEFGPDAARPDLPRQEQLTAELCNGPTLTYLEGRWDPEGQYTISPILPPKSSWERGDRTMLCGIMAPGADGRAREVVGVAAQQDQSRAFKPDTCVRVSGDLTSEVPCSEPHAWQVTQMVNLGELFPQGWPTVDQQNEKLNEVCTGAARNYLGGDDGLYYSTLTPFWNTIQQQSWAAGSRTVNCALTYGRQGGGFAELVGDVRSSFTIDGAPPKQLPKRNPLRR